MPLQQRIIGHRRAFAHHPAGGTENPEIPVRPCRNKRAHGLDEYRRVTGVPPLNLPPT